jgi:hypothetical protein
MKARNGDGTLTMPKIIEDAARAPSPMQLSRICGAAP